MDCLVATQPNQSKLNSFHESLPGTSKETCPSPNDYCYNMTADLTSLNNVKKGGCSSTRCIVSNLVQSQVTSKNFQLARNKCMTQSIGGTQIQFCCCNTGDLCNSKLTVSLFQVFYISTLKKFPFSEHEFLRENEAESKGLFGYAQRMNEENQFIRVCVV